MPVLMVFFDGWGIGSDDVSTNPFLTAPLPTLRYLCDESVPTRGDHVLTFDHAILVPTDATLGVPGLPQSATGQTTLFSGVNAAQAIGEHLGPYPNAALRQILTTDSLFQRLSGRGLRVAFANAYPPIFFARLARNSARRSATSYAMQAAGVRYRDIDDLRRGSAVSAFVTNERWITFGADVPLITARQAGQNLAGIAGENDLSLFEYFLTDVAGHRSKPAFTAHVLAEMDELLAGVLDVIDLDNTLLITTSDHGNIEDASARGHTLNPVPTLLVGAGREDLAHRIRSLVDVTPAIESWFESGPK